MAKTYEPIAKATLGSEAATIEFTSIPAIYTDLILVLNGKTSTAGTGTSQICARINSDTGSNYSSTDVGGDGSSVGSGRDTNQTFILNIAWPNSGSTTISPGIAILQFQSYSNTNVNKTVLTSIAAAGQIIRAVSLWRSTAAISALTLYFDSTNKHAAGTVATLYGIKAKSPVLPLLTESTKTTSSVSAIIGNYDAGLTYTATSSAGTATVSTNTVTVSGLTEGQNITLTVTATNGANSSSSNTISLTSEVPLPEGGTITTSDGYRIHTFTSSGTFTAYDTREVEYLVVAGGGGGGWSYLGSLNTGGGAGGYRSSVTGENSGGGASAESKLSTTAQSYAITIGGGGNGGASGTTASNGSASSLGTIVSSVGGGRGCTLNAAQSAWIAANSGGSGGGANNQYTTPGSGTTGQGYRGGNYSGSTYGAGGGGAGGVGSSSTSNAPGGVGVSSSITGSAVTRAVGGVGGTTSGTGSSGAANSGRGGGGARGSGGSGGSGIVIIRYPV